jgi:hypothetical protein
MPEVAGPPGHGAGSEPDLYSPFLRARFEASLGASQGLRSEVIRRVEEAAGLPRPGTSGAANAFVILVGSEFGVAVPSDRPGYHDVDGAADLWNLRVGQPNPHFDAKWDAARRETRLWHRLHPWLIDAFDGDQAIAHSMFCWANLSVTTGGGDLGTEGSHRRGMAQHVGPLAEASHCRILATTDLPTQRAVGEWALVRDASRMVVPLSAEELEVLVVPSGAAPILVGRVGHPSRGVSRVAFVERLQALLRLAEETAGA